MNCTERVSIVRYKGSDIASQDDTIAVEAPLELRINKAGHPYRQLAITMRTPGEDKDLVTGFLHAEGIIQSTDDIENIQIDQDKAMITLSDTSVYDVTTIDRRLLVSTSCGVCGKLNAEGLEYSPARLAWSSKVQVDSSTLSQISATMIKNQEQFNHTGGVHAAAQFSADGELIAVREDIGRHNALDKLIGDILLREDTPVIILLSGRTSFEMVERIQ